MFINYIDLLNAVKKDGEVILPSNSSLNRSFETKELTNIQIKFIDFKQLLINDDEVNYYEKELQWYFDTYEKPKHISIELNHEKRDKNPIIKQDLFVTELRKLAKNIIGCCNRCGPNSNYGEMCLRLKNHMGLTQFDWCIEKLKRDKNTRQSVAFYNNPNYQYFSNDDFVCCLTQLFNIKDNKLNTVINSRSNDLINSFRFDSIWWRIFQTLICNKLKETYPDLEIGYMLINIFSAHYYIKDQYKIDIINQLNKENKFKSISKIYL